MQLKRVLVVDDDSHTRRQLAETLRVEFGAIVREASCNEEVLKTISRWRMDLIVQDLARPGGSGVELLKLLRANPNTKDIPVVVVSGQARLGSADVLKAGAHAHAVLAKPWDEQELLEVARQILKEEPREILAAVHGPPLEGELPACLVCGTQQYQALGGHTVCPRCGSGSSERSKAVHTGPAGVAAPALPVSSQRVTSDWYATLAERSDSHFAKVVNFEDTDRMCYSQIKFASGERILVSISNIPQPEVKVYRMAFGGLVPREIIWEYSASMAGGASCFVQHLETMFGPDLRTVETGEVPPGTALFEIVLALLPCVSITEAERELTARQDWECRERIECRSGR